MNNQETVLKEYVAKFNCQLAEEQLRIEVGSDEKIWSICGIAT